MMRWLLLGMGCVGAGCAGLWSGLYVSFPATDVARWAEWQFHAKNKDYAVEVGDIRPWIMPGLAASDVTLYTVKKGHRTKDNPDPAGVRTPVFTLDSLAVRMQLLPRLFGKWSFAYSAELLGGSVSGHYARGSTVAELSFDLEDLDLSKAPLEKEDYTVHLDGTLAGESDLVLDAEDVKASTGALELVFEGLKLAEGSKVMGFELPVVAFSTAKVRLEAKDGKLEVTEGTFDGDLLDMTLSGDISLNKKLERSRNHLELAVTLPEDIDKLASLAPNLKRARDADGAYHFSIGGTVLAPTFRAGKGVSSRLARNDDDEGEGSSRARLPGSVGDEGSEGEGDADQAREERRKRREERIKERRERLKQRREEAASRGGDDEGLGSSRDLMDDPERDDFSRDDRRGRDMDGDDEMLPELPPDDDGPQLPNPEDDNARDFGPGAPIEGMPDWGPPGNDRPPDGEE